MDKVKETFIRKLIQRLIRGTSRKNAEEERSRFEEGEKQLTCSFGAQ